MEPPAITRRRKPFLAPIFLGLMLTIALVGIVAAFVAYAESGASVAIIVRHAQAPGAIEDPPLSEVGAQRAQTLARMLGDPGSVDRVTAVFATEARRTQQTATPLAARLAIPVTLVHSKDVDQLVRRLLHRDNEGTAVVVTDAVAIPRIISGLAKISIPAIADSDYDRLYVVTVPRFGKASVVSLKY